MEAWQGQVDGRKSPGLDDERSLPSKQVKDDQVGAVTDHESDEENPMRVAM